MAKASRRAVFSAAFCFAVFSAVVSTAVPLVSLRSAGPALPESIARESLAAADRAMDAIDESSMPEGGVSDRIAATFADVARALLRDPASAVPESAQLRLASLASSPALSPAATAFCLVFGGDEDGKGWERLAGRSLPADPSPSDVAVRALARLSVRRRFESAGGAVGSDVIAHVRWLESRLKLASADSSAFRPEGAVDPLDAETAFLVSVLAGEIPAKTLAGDESLFPVFWRSKVADRLLASQTFDSRLRPVWCAAGDDKSRTVEKTALAIAAIVLLAR